MGICGRIHTVVSDSCGASDLHFLYISFSALQWLYIHLSSVRYITKTCIFHPVSLPLFISPSPNLILVLLIWAGVLIGQIGMDWMRVGLLGG